MKKQCKKWIISGCSVALALAFAAGCSSMEDRIENVVSYELEQCQESDDTFYTVRTHAGAEYEILAELCHEEPSEVEMQEEWRGTMRTGPLLWTAEEDQDERTVFIRRAAWDTLDTAMSQSGSDDPDTLRKAEESFAQAQQEYGASTFVRQERLKNLLRLRNEVMKQDDEESLVGDDAEAYFAELIEWSQSEDKPEVAAQARLALVDHIETYINRQERSLRTLGARDDRLKAAAQHAEDDGDTEAAEEYRDELQKRIEGRPEVREQLNARIEDARREACQYVDALNVDNISGDQLRRQVMNTMNDYECRFEPREQDSETEEEEQDSENGDE